MPLPGECSDVQRRSTELIDRVELRRHRGVEQDLNTALNTVQTSHVQRRQTFTVTTDRQTDTQTHRQHNMTTQTDRQTHRQHNMTTPYRQATCNGVRPSLLRLTDRQTDRHTDSTT